jgi:hypothetical protein
MRDAIQNGGNGKVGWAITCDVLGVAEEDICTNEEGSIALANLPGLNGTELLVLGDYSKSNKPKAACTQTRLETGDVLGSVALLQANGQGLQFSS